MTILLRRNSVRDNYFTVHGMYVKEGDIVELVEIRDKYCNNGIVPTIGIMIKELGQSHPAELSCFDYVMGSDHG